MDEGIQLSSQLQGFKKAPDSSQQVFNILDDISATFKKELESAQGKEVSQAISASPKQKESAKAEKKAQAQQEGSEPKEEAQAEGSLNVNVSFENTEDPEAGVTEGEVSSEELITSSSPAKEEPPVETPLSELPVKSEEVAPETSVPVEVVEGSPELETEVPVERVLTDSATEAQEVQAEVTVSDEPAPSEEFVEEEVQAPEEVLADAPKEIEEETPREPTSEASAESTVQVELVNQPEKVATQEVSVSEARANEEPVDQPIAEASQAAKVQEQPKHQPTQTTEVRQVLPKKQAHEVEAQVERSEDMQSPAASKESEEVREDFHSLTSSESIVIQLDAEESAQILKGLQDLSEHTQVQAPNFSQISNQVLESLKGSQSSLLQQEGVNRSPGSEAGAIVRGAGLQMADEEAETQAATPRFRDPKLEELKNKIIQQVRVKMKMNLKGPGGELRMQLHPKYLGKVKVKIILEANTAKASFVVENETVREMLQRSLGSLENSLSDQGLDVSSIEISVAEDGGTQGDGSGAFQSVEDQEAVRDFIASFRRFDEEEVEEDSQSGASDDETDGALNIMA